GVMSGKPRSHDNFGTDKVAKPTREKGEGTLQSPPLATLVHEKTGQIHPLLTDITTIGRDKTSTIMVREDTAVSRRHAHVLRKGVNFVIEDLGSSNGVYINGRKLEGSHILQVGDKVEIGAQVYLFKRRA
ncbi:MAG: FHA domain-containing protein, partial [Planctomycetes bacterium]|nr:FHA domain-containing protein [Planctomycetota bacterium]